MRLAWKGGQGFLKKYYPTEEGGDFFENPQGLTLPDDAGRKRACRPIFAGIFCFVAYG